jgi:hypothetical protein
MVWARMLAYITGTVDQELLRMGKENPSWGYDRIVGALANLGHQVSPNTRSAETTWTTDTPSPVTAARDRLRSGC